LSFNNDWGRFTNDLEFGIRFHADEEDRFQLEDDFRMANGTMVLTTAGIAGTQANRIGSANALSFYIKDNLDFGQLTVSPGLRMENIWFENRNFGRNDVNRTGQNLSKSNLNITEWIPGVGATFAFNENITLISGIHKGFSPPGPSSSEGTESERSVNYELGGRFANPVTAIELIGFFNNYSNLLGSDLAAGGGGGTTSQFNAGDVDVFGLEFSLNTSLSGLFNLSNTKLPIQVSYTFTEATFQSSFESDFSPWGSVQKGDNIPFIPEHQFNASVGVNHKKISINASANTQSAMRTVAGSGSIPADVRTDAHFIMDAGASYQFTENIQLFSNIRNLFDEVYIVSDRPAGLRPGLPRTLIGGLRFNM
ncbi:MAG: TonB-dependent receptor family protein, partial [Balneolaceae bacterium]